MKRFMRRQEQVEGIQNTGDNLEEVARFISSLKWGFNTEIIAQSVKVFTTSSTKAIAEVKMFDWVYSYDEHTFCISTDKVFRELFIEVK